MEIGSDLLMRLLNTTNIGAGSNNERFLQIRDNLLNNLPSGENKEWAPSAEGIGGWSPSGYWNVDNQAKKWLAEGYDSEYTMYVPGGVHGESSGIGLTQDALKELQRRRQSTHRMEESMSRSVSGWRSPWKYNVEE